MSEVDKKTVRVEMTEETLLRLLCENSVCAAEFRCLDSSSKDRLLRLCLKSCINRSASCLDDKSPCLTCSRHQGKSS